MKKMKQIAKKKILLIGIGVSFLFSLQAYSAFDKREDRQQNSTEKTKFHDTFRPAADGGGGSGAGAGTNGIGFDDPTGNGTGEKPNPIGDAAGFVFVLGLTYGVYVLLKKKQSLKNSIQTDENHHIITSSH
jgi:hypothetical protein